MARVLEVEGLSARYGHVEALRLVDLHVDDGELVAVLGPNGAGKSTLMRALLGLVSTDGRVRFRGNDVPAAQSGGGGGVRACSGARRAWDLRSDDGRRKLGARRLSAQARSCGIHPQARSRAVAVSAAQGAAVADRRFAVRRRAADAGDRPRIDGGAKDSSARRAVARACAARSSRRSWKSSAS